MLRNIFSKILRDQRQPLSWWLLGLGSMGLMVIFLFPSIGSNPGYADYVRSMPQEYLTMVMGGMEDLDLQVASSYLGAYLFAMMLPLSWLIYAITLGANAIAGEEERKTLDLLLANPVTRRRVVLEKFLGMCAVMAVLALVLWLLLWAGVAIVGMDVAGSNLGAAIASALLLAALFGALALALGAATGSRGLSLGLATALAILAYFLQSLGPVVGWLEPAQKLSPFYYYSSNSPLRNGLDPLNATALLVPALLFVLMAMVAFRRRDLAV